MFRGQDEMILGCLVLILILDFLDCRGNPQNKDKGTVSFTDPGDNRLTPD
jgi:hypothetical protein